MESGRPGRSEMSVLSSVNKNTRLSAGIGDTLTDYFRTNFD